MALYSLAACTPELLNSFFLAALIASVFALLTGVVGLLHVLLAPRLLPLSYSEDALRFMRRAVLAIGSIGLLVCALQLALAAWFAWQGPSYVPQCAITSDVLNDAQYHRVLVAIAVSGITVFASLGLGVVAVIATRILTAYARIRWPRQSLSLHHSPPFLKPTHLKVCSNSAASLLSRQQITSNQPGPLACRDL